MLSLLADVATGDEASKVLRTLIVSLGGFCAGMAFVKALWRLSPWIHPKRHLYRQPANLFFGILLLSFAGISVLTTDHIYRHLLDNDTPLWQLWLALLSFTVGAVALVGLIATRPERQKQ